MEKSLVARAGDFFLLIFDMPKGSRLRSGMNIMVFEKSGGKILWNPSFSDPLLPLAATSDFHSPKSADGFPALTHTCRNLAGKSLPILCFKNGALLSADGVDAVEKLPEAVFYRKAQNIFYSWKLDEYASYMTEESKNRFNSQFGGMPESERKKILGEYFSWGKTYRKVMDAGAQKLILFTRNKSGAEPYNDAAYLRETHEGSLLISRFGADKSPLDLFLSKYVFPTKQNYADAISKKYLKGHSE